MTRAPTMYLLALLLLPVFGCRLGDDPRRMEGVTFDDEEVFRRMALPGVEIERAYQALDSVVRRNFAGGPIVSDPTSRSIELTRPFADRDLRVKLFAAVDEGEDGAVVELLTLLEELSTDLTDLKSDPWVVTDQERDWLLENLLFQETWDELMVRDDSGVEPSTGAAPAG